MKLLSRIFNRLKKLLIPKPKILKDNPTTFYNIKRLGSKYGGWAFADLPLNSSKSEVVIISAGLGEDASFDIDFASEYRSQVFIVDPTPRAILHFKEIETRMGLEREIPYNIQSGKQEARAYDLRALKGTLMLVPYALWNRTEELKFFLPSNPDHVSCSISDIQRNNRMDGDSLIVKALNISDLCDKYSIAHKQIDILKLDIEGAEIEVLHSMLDKNIKPIQILVEYDELMFPSRKNYSRVQGAHDRLIQSGYECIFSDGVSCFSYILDSLRHD